MRKSPKVTVIEVKWRSLNNLRRKHANQLRQVHGFNESLQGSTYDDDELEFIKAMDRYMRTTGIRFPKFTEVLAVAKKLGYRKP
jgi:hypothetical protein